MKICTFNKNITDKNKLLNLDYQCMHYINKRIAPK